MTDADIYKQSLFSGLSEHQTRVLETFRQRFVEEGGSGEQLSDDYDDIVDHSWAALREFNVPDFLITEVLLSEAKSDEKRERLIYENRQDEPRLTIRELFYLACLYNLEDKHLPSD